MMQAIKQSSTASQWFALATHKAGSHTSPNNIQIGVHANFTPASKYKHTTVGGTVRATGNMPYEPVIAYQYEDKTFTSTPYLWITELRMRFQQILFMNINFAQLPNLRVLWLRGNLATFSPLYLGNNYLLEELDLSDNYINNLTMPSSSYINFIYVGGLVMDGMPPWSIIDSMMYHVNTNVNDIRDGNMLSDACVGTANASHVQMLQKGWTVGHLTCTHHGQQTVFGANETTKIVNSIVVSSKYNWEVVAGYPSWVILSNTTSAVKGPSNHVLSIKVQQNTTGQSRSGYVYIRKLKDDGTEYKGRAAIQITQLAT